MPVRLPDSGHQTFPFGSGPLHVNAARLEGRRPSDTFDVTLGPGRDVSLVLLELRGSPLEAKAKAELSELREELKRLALAGLREGTPLHAISLDLVRKLFDSPLSQLGATLMRCSASRARVEVLTAGMPPVVCAHADGSITLHGAAITAPLTALTHAPAPVELAPLVWGSTWLATSNGFGPSAEPRVLVEQLARELELGRTGTSLSRESPRALRELISQLPGAARRSERDDASLVLVTADPSARRLSGIEPR